MPRSKAALAKAVVPRRPPWTDGDGNGHVRPQDRLEALEQRLANFEQALDTTIRRMAAIQAEFDAMHAKSRG